MGNTSGWFSSSYSSIKSTNSSCQKASTHGAVLLNIRNFFTGLLNKLLNPKMARENSDDLVASLNRGFGESGAGEYSYDWVNGGIFSNKADMIKYMHLSTELKNKELAGWELTRGDETIYFLNGGIHSKCNFSFNDWEGAGAKFISEGWTIKNQYHTENANNYECKGGDPCIGPSLEDYDVLNKMNLNYGTEAMFIIEENNVYKLEGGQYQNYVFTVDCVIVPAYWSGHTELWNGN